MLHSSTQKLLLKLHEMTLDGAIAWKEAENDAVKLETEGYCVLIESNPVGMELTTVKGRLLEKADETVLSSTPAGEGRNFIDVISDIADEGSRYARGTEQAINAILGAAETGALSEGLDFPFRDAGEETGGGLDTPETAAMAAAVGDLAARLNSEEQQGGIAAPETNQETTQEPPLETAPETAAETPTKAEEAATSVETQAEEVEASTETKTQPAPDAEAVTIDEAVAAAPVEESAAAPDAAAATPQEETHTEELQPAAEEAAVETAIEHDTETEVPSTSSTPVENTEVVQAEQTVEAVEAEQIVELDQSPISAEHVDAAATAEVEDTAPTTQPIDAPAEESQSEAVVVEFQPEAVTDQNDAVVEAPVSPPADNDVNDAKPANEVTLPPPPHDFLLSAEAAAASNHPTVSAAEDTGAEGAADSANVEQPASSGQTSVPAANTNPAAIVPTPPTMPVQPADSKTPSPVGFQQPVFEPPKEDKPAAGEGLKKVTALGFALGRHSGSTVRGIPNDIEQRANDHSKSANGEAPPEGSNGAYKPWG